MSKPLFLLATACSLSWALSSTLAQTVPAHNAVSLPKNTALPAVDLSEQGWKKEIPRPIHPNKDYLDLYEKTWEIAAKRVRIAPEGTPVRRYMDENCYDEQIWIWDNCFMAMYCKYAPRWYPGMETLDNFYYPIHEGVKSPLIIHLYDNPPLFAWIEDMHHNFTGDTARIQEVLLNKKFLQRHFDWFKSVKRGTPCPSGGNKGTYLDAVGDKGFTWTGGASGMDNTPRGREAGGYDKVLWIDAICQQALSALHISNLLEKMGKKEDSLAWKKTYNELKTKINTAYWDEKDGFYYDIDKNTGEPCRVKTIASFWPLIAGIATPEQAKRLVEKLKNPNEFGGERPLVTLSREDKDFNKETGDYWRGGIWLPTAYMVIKGLEKYGYKELADELSGKIMRLQSDTYKNFKPATIWEAYNPSSDAPTTESGRIARPDFCGWSALGPISLFIENILGFRDANALTKTLTWDLKRDQGEQGMENFRFGSIQTNLLFDGKKSIKISSNEPYTLLLNGKKYRVKKGQTTLSL